MVKEMLLSGESKSIEYKVTVPDKIEKYMKTVVAGLFLALMIKH